MAHRRVPLDKRVSRRYPTSVGRISGGGLSFGDFSLATQRKVTRPGPKGGRNPIEGRALAFHAAKPHQGLNRRLGNSVKIRQGAGETPSRTESSHSMGRSRIKGSTAGSGIRRASVVVERKFAAVQCAALIAPYGVPLRGKAAPSQPIRERPNRLRYSNLQSNLRLQYTRGIMGSVTLALSQEERGQGCRKPQAGATTNRKGSWSGSL